MAPVVQFAKEAWRSLLCPGRQGIIVLGQLGAMWRQIKLQTPKRWMDIRGPIGAAILSIKRLRGEWHEPFVLTSDLGVQIPFLVVGPKFLGLEMARAYRRNLERAAASRAGLQPDHRLNLQPTRAALRPRSGLSTETTSSDDSRLPSSEAWRCR